MSDKIQLEIVLDDGSIQKGFAKIKQQGQDTSDSLNKAFGSSDFGKTKLNETSGAMSNLAEQTSEFISAFKSIIPTIAAASSVVFGFKKAFDLAIEGESLLRIEKTFESLSTQAGIAGDELKNNFTNALGGLIDDSDAVQALNRALITLGERAQATPQLFDLARRATNAFGGDAIQNFEAINQAIATGATRQLKNIGLTIDADKALTNYAKTLGVTKDQLSESGRQQAILNEILNVGGERFKNISNEIGGLTSAQQRLSVTLKNIGDELALFVQRNYGSVFEQLAIGLNRFIKELNGSQTSADKVEILRERLEGLQNELNKLNLAKFEREGKNSFTKLFDGFGLDSVLNQRIQGTQKQIEQLNNEISILTKNSEQLNKPTTIVNNDAQVDVSARSRALSVEIEKRKALELEYNQFLITQNQQRINLELEAAKNKNDFDQQILITQKLNQDNILLQEQIFQQQLEKINQDFSARKGFSDEQRQVAIEAAESTHKARLAQINDQSAKQILDIENAKNKKLLDTQRVVQSSVQNSVVQSVNALGVALTRGGDFFQNFGNAVQGIIGDLLINIGNALIVQGLAIETFIQAINRLLPGSGLAAAAAGVGLVLFGNALKSAVGGGASSTSAPATGSTGGGGLTFNEGSDLTQTPINENTQAQREANQQIVVQINGNVFDGDETGLRIVDILNKEFDRSGSTIRRGALA